MTLHELRPKSERLASIWQTFGTQPFFIHLWKTFGKHYHLFLQHLNGLSCIILELFTFLVGFGCAVECQARHSLALPSLGSLRGYTNTVMYATLILPLCDIFWKNTRSSCTLCHIYNITLYNRSSESNTIG